jgi:hypothetical protein
MTDLDYLGLCVCYDVHVSMKSPKDEFLIMCACCSVRHNSTFFGERLLSFPCASFAPTLSSCSLCKPYFLRLEMSM